MSEQQTSLFKQLNALRFEHENNENCYVKNKIEEEMRKAASKGHSYSVDLVSFYINSSQSLEQIINGVSRFKKENPEITVRTVSYKDKVLIRVCWSVDLAEHQKDFFREDRVIDGYANPELNLYYQIMKVGGVQRKTPWWKFW